MKPGLLLLLFVSCSLSATIRTAPPPPPPPQQQQQQERDIHKRAGEFVVPYTGYPAYGVPSGAGGFMSYYERAILVWINVVRASHTSFTSDWMTSYMKDNTLSSVFGTSQYSPQPALYWDLNLNRAARAHSFDSVTNCPGTLTHNDCNSTSISTRIAKFYPGSAGEIFWAWTLGWGWSGGITLWPYFAVAGWICDGYCHSDGGFSGCPADGSAGHRNIIMTAGSDIGCGFYNVGTTSSTTCDSGNTKFYKNRRIASAAHVLVPGGTTYRFLVNYVSNATTAPSPTQVVLDGVVINMVLKYGTANKGTYWTNPASTFTQAQGCQTYYFKFGTEKYPAAGQFKTYGLGACTTDWTSEEPPTGVTSSLSASFLLVGLTCILLLI
jgi:hypothetical protein